MQKSPLQIARQNYQPKMPVALQGAVRLVEGEKTQSVADQEEIKKLFPNTYGLPLITFEPTTGKNESEPLNVGVILSGGQAPGGHNVIAGLFDGLKSLNPKNKLYGFLGGPSGLIEGFLNGMEVKEAIQAMKEYITNTGIGRVKVNYRLRDAIFSRQRYWGEPFPIYYKDGMPYAVDEKDLPLRLPEVKKFEPTSDGRPPLGNAENWTYKGYPLELCTMPGFAGSSAYYLRYMDPHNDEALVSHQANDYWRQVDLYLGGSEHATGHLIYSRFWNKFLYDLGYRYLEN